MRRGARLTRPKPRPAPWVNAARWLSPVTVPPPRPALGPLEVIDSLLLAGLYSNVVGAVMSETRTTWVVTLKDGTRVAIAARMLDEFENERG